MTQPCIEDSEEMWKTDDDELIRQVHNIFYINKYKNPFINEIFFQPDHHRFGNERVVANHGLADDHRLVSYRGFVGIQCKKSQVNHKNMLIKGYDLLFVVGILCYSF
jgi:hypothetical protein